MTLIDLYGLFTEYPEFVRVGMAYIVNLSHVDSLASQDIHFDEGRKIRVPRGANQAIKKQYFQFYCTR